MQIEARIGQHPEITELITLWGQNQSQLIRGNLLVIPVQNNMLYAEPFYIQSNQGQIPEFKKIVLVWQDRIAIGDTIEDALRKLKGETEIAPAETKEPAAEPAAEPAPAEIPAGESPSLSDEAALLVELEETLRKALDLVEKINRLGDYPLLE
jgi:uncharacterized membrane protein (UPF0182 family)